MNGVVNIVTSLRAVWYRVGIPAGTFFFGVFQHHHTGSGVHPASCLIGTAGCFYGAVG